MYTVGRLSHGGMVTGSCRSIVCCWWYGGVCSKVEALFKLLRRCCVVYDVPRV